MGAQLWPVVVLLVVLATVNTEAGSCRAAGCSKSGGNGIFKYKAGQTYVYNLEGKSLSELPEQQGDSVRLELNAVAEVHFGADCTNTLSLRDVSVTGPNAKKYGNLKELEAHPVRFSFNDGQVEPELCADDADTNTALNIKRAVISLLQVSTPQSTGSASKHETDVFGSCPTDFVLEKQGGSTHVTKSRNLNKCSHREDLRQRVLSTAFVSDSPLQSSPLLDSRLVVEQTVKGGILQGAESRETYLYRPFANKDAGAKTVITTKLTYLSTAGGSPHPVNGGTARSLIFDAPHGDGITNSNSAAVIAALQKAGQSMPDSVGSSAATEFRNLVEVFRHSSKDDLLTVYGQVKAGAGIADKVSARKVYLDALFRAGTGDSVQVAVELLNSNELTGNLARLWYTSFGFVRHATLATLTSAATLLDNPNAPKEAFLGVGSLAAQYCREHDCQNSPQLAELLAKLAKPLAAGCKCATNEEENKIIAALKGIENVREVNEATAELLRVCASDITVPARVRVSALETFRIGSCQPQLKKTALEILKNTNEDSEIRIKAYLAAVTCPCGKCANTLKEILDSEPVNQVGSFIVSHLRNIRASSNPDKALAKQHLSQVRSSKRFPEDVRRYSNNREFSYFLDAVNVGSSVERTVIYSQQSYLPRSTSLNITTEIFGHSFNLLEIGTRAENLDRIVEAYFGPKGYFKSHDIEELVANGKATFKGIKEKLQARLKETLRTRRSVPQDKLEAFRNQVALVNDRKSIDLDFNVKVFGSNVGGLNYHGNAKELSPENIFDKLFDCLDKGIDKAKSFNYDIKRHGVFLESELAYPTGLGFPLKLTVAGSSAVHLKFDGKVDLHAIIKDPKNAHIQFELVPSAAVEITGELSIDAYAVEAGLKLSGVLHTATGVNVDIKSVDGTGFDVNVGLPVKKQEIVNFKTEVLTSVQERGQVPVETAVAFNVKRKDYHGCFDQLSPLIGLTFCGDVGVPFDGVTSKAAFFPLNGPSKLVLTVEGDDVTSYRFRGVANVKDPERRSLELLIDTPNSKTNRKLELVLEANKKPNREVRVTLNSPYKQASAELVVIDNDSEHSITAKLLNDGAEYLAKVGAEISGSENQKTYKPLLEYSTPNSKDKVAKKGKKGKSQSDFNVEGTMVVDKNGDTKKYTFNNVVITAPAGKVSVNGWIAHDKDSVSSDLKVTHGKDDSVLVKGKVQRFSASHFTVDGELVATQYPDLGVSLKWDYNRGQDQLETNLALIHGKDLTSDQSKVTAHALAKYRFVTIKDFEVSGSGNVAYPLLGIVGKAEVGATPKSVNYILDGTYEKNNVKSSLKAKTGTTTPGDYDVEFEAKVLDNSVTFVSKRDIVSPTQNKFSNSLEITPGGKYELNADVTCQRGEGTILSKVLAEAKIAGQADKYTLDAGIELNSQLLDSYAKASVGSVDYIDVSGKLTKGANPTGSFKVLLKDHIDGSGQFKFVNGAGSLALSVDLKKLERKIKASGDLTVAGTTRALNLDVFLNADKDPSKKIHVSSTSDVQPNHIDSKNILELFEYKTELNFKGDLTGKLTDGHLIGSGDLTLPNERYITASIDRVLHLKPGNTDMLAKIEVTAAEKKGAAPRVFTLNARGDKIDIRRGVFDVEYDVVYKTSAGKDVNYHLLAKSLPDGDKQALEFKGLIKGSLLELAPLVHVTVGIAKPVVEYKVTLNLAADSNLELTGKCQKSDGTLPYLSETNLELNLPTGELKNIKLVEKISFLRGVDGAPCQFKGSATGTYNNENTLKVEVEAQGNKAVGSGKVSVTLPKDATPHVLEGSFKVDRTEGVSREVSATYNHGDKEAHVDVKVQVPESKKSIKVTIAGRTPLEKLRTVSLVFNGARSERVVESDTTIVTNDKTVVITSKYGVDPKSPIFEFGVVHPGGKSFVGFNFQKKDSIESEIAGEINVEHAGDTLAVKLDARVPSPHDFEIVLDIDSTKLKLNKVHIVLVNKPGVKSGKSVSIKVTEAGESTIDGKLNYKFEDGSAGVLYEAAGNLKVRGESKAAKISVKRNIITSDNENGIETSIEAALGDKSLDIDFKRTNKEAHLITKLCKEKDACGTSKYQSTYKIELAELYNEVIIELDNTGLGLNNAFSYKRVTERKDRQFSTTVDISSKNQDIYKSKVLISDKEAVIVINTPQREVAAEAKYQLTIDPANKQHVTYNLVASAWLDKGREPNVKSTFVIANDYLRTDDSITVTSETKFQNPALKKDLVVKGKTVIGGRHIVDSNVEIDIFEKKGHKIVVDTKIVKNEIANGYNFTATFEVKSKGQNLDITSDSHIAASTSVLGIGSNFFYTDVKNAKKDLGFGFQATTKQVALFVKSPTDVLVNVDLSGKIDDHLPSFKALVDVVGMQAVIAEGHFEKNSKFIYSVYKKDTPDRKVQGVYIVDLSSKAVAQSEWVQGAETKELYNVVLTWGKDVKPQVSYSLDNAKELLEYIKKDVAAGVEKVKALSKESSTEASTELNDLIEGLKKAQPNLKPLIASYQEQVKAIRSEIASDKSIQQLSDVVKNFIGTASESVAQISEIFAKIADKLVDFFEKLSTMLLTSLKKIIPTITDSLNKIFQVSVDISNTLVNQALVALQRLVELVKKHEGEFKQIIAVVAEIGRDVARVVGRGLKQAWSEVSDFLSVLTDQLKALPMFGMIQERLQELKQQAKDYTVPEQVFEAITEITNGLKESLPTEELKDFVITLTSYIEKVLKKQKVDDIAELKVIYQKLVSAVKSVIVLVRAEVGAKDPQGLASVYQWPLHLKALFKIPVLASVHFSPLALLRSDDLPTLKELYYTYRPTLNPLDWIPPYNSYGILIDSSHFFTFDRRHYTFKGTCSYILAQDVVNGNFTLVLNLDNGKFKSVQLSDGTDTVEVIASRSLLLNGKPQEFPLRTKEIGAWRDYHTINLKTVGGVWIKLDMDHHFAMFHVSGFYHGQVRGLLGDLNNEPFDDFRLPSGKVSEDAAEFGNAYNVGGKCAPGTAVGHEHHGHHEEACTSLFSANSPLRSAFGVVDPTAFREACDHLLTETADKKQEYACRIAGAYVTAARTQHVFVNVPNVCAECSSGDKTFGLGETVSVKAPNKLSDIIFIVEQVTNNAEIYKELVVPLVTSLTNDLKSKGITDVDISLIGYGHPEVKWPTHFTSGGKLTFDGKTNVDFGDAKVVPTEPKTGQEKWQVLKHKIAVELGIGQLRDAMVEASKYPFRVGASKTVILVTASNCEKSVLPVGLQKLRLFLGQKEMRDRGITLHVVSALEGFNVAGSKDAKQLKSVVGFDKNTVYSLSDAKKKVLEGNDDLRHDIEYTQDVCVEAAQNVNGAAFNAHNFLEGKANQRKQFLQVLGRRVVDSLTEELTEDCRCSLYKGVHTETRCKVTGRKESEPLIAAKGKGKKN